MLLTYINPERFITRMWEQAISIKETRLIATLSSAPLRVQSEPGTDTGSVHHVSPRTTTEGLDEGTIQSGGEDEADMSSRDSNETLI